MFVYNEATRLFWFNAACVDCGSEFMLIGMLFGLAIYNSIIVDVQLPLVLYKKLMGKRGTFWDLGDLDPVSGYMCNYPTLYTSFITAVMFIGALQQCKVNAGL